MRIVFLTLEFSSGTFSGNGVLAQSQVRALAHEGQEVFVVCARPSHWKQPPNLQGASTIYEVPVSKWGHLDSAAPWEEYAAGCKDAALIEQLKAFKPEVAMGVDWTSLRAFHNIREHLPGLQYVYLNYRVFTRTASPADLQHISSMERGAIEEAIETIVLGRCDSEYLKQHLLPKSKPWLVPKVLLPPLREEMLHAGALNPTKASQHTHVSSASTQRSTPSHDAHPACCLAANHIPAMTQAEPLASTLASEQPCDAALKQQSGSSHGSSSSSLSTMGLALDVAQPVSDSKLDVQPEGWVASVRVVAGTLSGSSTGGGMTDADEDVSDDLKAARQGLGGSHDGSSADLAMESDDAADDQEDVLAFIQSRPYITCCVRLSEEKEPFRFVDLAIALHQRGSLQRYGLTPLLVGSATDPYAQELKEKLRTHVPGAVIAERFLSPDDLATIYRQTRLNVHPCSYDAYGMTVVESASQGAPSLVNVGGGVGATDLLLSEQGEVCLTDIRAQSEVLASAVERLLQTPQVLHQVAHNAQRKARSWSEQANGRRLIELTEKALKECSSHV